jgi:hypothetical protein
MLEPPPRLRRDDVPRALGELLSRTMSKSPAERPMSAAEFGQQLQEIQGGLGLPVTALPLASAPPAAVTTERQLPPPTQAREAEGRDVGVQTVTVGRAVAPPEDGDASTGVAPHQTSTRRIVLGTVAGVVCLLAVAGSLFLFGRGGGGGGATTIPVPTTTQVVDLPPPTPHGVTVARAPNGGGVVVAWQPVDEPGTGVTYQVRQQNPSGHVVNTDALTVTIDDVGPNQHPCYVVIAISPGGQTSNDSDLACLR